MLRKSKGDIWQAVEKCIQKKEEECVGGGSSSAAKEQLKGNANQNQSKSKDFTLEHNESGPGKDNHEINFCDVDYQGIDCDDEVSCVIDPTVCLFHPDDTDEEGDEELINLFIEKWKYEKEQEMNQRKGINYEDDYYERKLFDEDDQDENSTSQVEDRQLSPKELLKQKKEKAREKFFSSLEEIDSIVTNGPETGQDLRKYLFNKYFGKEENGSDQDTSLPSCSSTKKADDSEAKSEESRLEDATNSGTKSSIVSTKVESNEGGRNSSSDEYEYVEVEEYEGEEDLTIPDSKEARRAFFGGKNLDEYVSDQDGITISPDGLVVTAVAEVEADAMEVSKREIDTSNLGNTFEFLMSLNVDDLDADETIQELMKISGETEDDQITDKSAEEENSGRVRTMKLRPMDVGVMSRSESPRFMVEPDMEEGVVKIIPKGRTRLNLSRTVSPQPSTSKYDSLTNLVIDPDQKYFECELCAAERVPVSDMITMLACSHQACKDCVKQYLTIQIRERSNIVIPCPFCREPDLSINDEEGIWNFVSLFDVLIRSLLDKDVHELYQRKIRDRTLMKDPNFRWCPSCSSGFIAANLCAVTVMCPDCQAVTCVKCNRIVSLVTIQILIRR